MTPPVSSWMGGFLRRCCLTLLLVMLLVLGSSPAVAGPPVAEAVFAGGCFWCLEHDLEANPGVLDVISGFSGGQLEKPTYERVSAGGTGHQEAVLVRFDPERIPYATLLRSYWRHIDPLDGDGQFCDRGDSYRPVIFPNGSEQEAQASNSIQEVAREIGVATSDIEVVIQPLDRFWPAEQYHQDYAERHAIPYTYYRFACGRDRRLDAVWRQAARSNQPWAPIQNGSREIP